MSGIFLVYTIKINLNDSFSMFIHLYTCFITYISFFILKIQNRVSGVMCFPFLRNWSQTEKWHNPAVFHRITLSLYLLRISCASKVHCIASARNLGTPLTSPKWTTNPESAVASGLIPIQLLMNAHNVVRIKWRHFANQFHYWQVFN